MKPSQINDKKIKLSVAGKAGVIEVLKIRFNYINNIVV